MRHPDGHLIFASGEEEGNDAAVRERLLESGTPADAAMIAAGPKPCADVLSLAATAREERALREAAEADRDYWQAQATMTAPCVDAVRAITTRLIPGGTGCAIDPERAVAAVDALIAERDRIDTAASRAAGEYMEAAHDLAISRNIERTRADAAEARLSALAGAAAEFVSARDGVNAALDADADGEGVRAAVERQMTARTALDAALAAAEGR